MATENKNRSGFTFFENRDLRAEFVVSDPVRDVK